MFSILFTDSDISIWIKKIFKIDKQYSYLKMLNDKNFYKISLITYPFILIIRLVTGIIIKVIDLINCPVCSGFHISWVFIYMVLGYPIFLSLAMAAFVVLIIKLIDKFVTFNV